MNFFKSILSDDPDPPQPENLHEPDPNSPLKPPRDDDNSSNADDGDPADGWSFGGLIKTLAIESVIETYRRDLQEFGSGLKMETEILRETASRAVKDLPASIEASASAAHGVLKSTAEIISKESLAFASDGEPETPETSRSLNSGRYSWFEAQLSAIQSDSSTFCEEPEDLEEYRKWKLGFELEKNRDEIDSLIGGNGSLEGVYRRLVPSAVDMGTFWCRYFYRVDKLKQQESVRANLVKRAVSVDDDEELSWDVDDEDDEDSKGGDAVGDNVSTSNGNLKPVEKQEGSNSGSPDDNVGGNANVYSGEKEVNSEVVAEVKRDENEKNDEEVSVEEKGDSSVVSSHQPKVVEKEEDLEWDEIEDTGSGDEKKMSGTAQNGSSNRAELRKRLSGEEDDGDDLNWDIEDDGDEPVKG
ncbi:hypothetical protein DH2020_001587 [Rehmannia glutinosa]|uniref:BSD domain-containing protein n=1 Tax=Rehmannia glutinosa TaxID=99300 RepID=A0ABR0Y0B5_REHGL